MNQIDGLLKDYEPEKPSMKPDVLEQMVKIEEERRKMAEKIAQEQGAQGQIMIQMMMEHRKNYQMMKLLIL